MLWPLFEACYTPWAQPMVELVEQWSLLKDPEVVEMSGKLGKDMSAVTQRAFRFVGGRVTATSGI